MIKKRKILFGSVDIGYRIELYSKFIKEKFSDQLEPESLTIFSLPAQHYKTTYTYEYNFHKKSILYRRTRAFLNFFSALFRYDIFHFFSGETLLPRKLRRLELAVYKLLGKRIIMHFVGSDIRSEKYIYWKEEHIREFLNGRDDFPKSLAWQRKLIRDAEKYADFILVSTPDLKRLISKGIFYPVVLDMNKFISELNAIEVPKKNKDEIVILHSPSSLDKSRLKGSSYVYEVLKRLAANPENRIRLILPAEEKRERNTNYSATRYELFKHFKEADIVIDQMVIGWYGLLSVEALAAGKHVFCYVDEDLRNYLFNDCPIQLVDVNTLEEKLLKHIDLMRSSHSSDLSAQIEWVKKYHSIENNNRPLLDAWQIKE